MANKLSDEIKTLYQRTGTNAGQLRTEAERAAFASNVKADIANIIYQYNAVIKPLIETLASEQEMNALDFGLSGNVIYTNVTSTKADALAYYDAGLDRARTVKETVDVLLSELSRLENLIDNIQDATLYDDTALRTLIGANDLNLDQLALDTMGSSYTLDGDGAADLNYPLSQAVDALGAFFTGFPGTGNTYATAYPSITFAVLLSQVVLDTTIPISTITNLTDYLSYIRTFIGMGTVGPETPTYTAHGAVQYVADGDSLEKSIRVLDSKLYDAAQREVSGDWVSGDTFVQTGGAPVTFGPLTLGVAPNTDMEYVVMNMADALANPTAYTSLSAPKNAAGTYATSATIELFTAPTTNPGAGPYNYVMTLFTNDTNGGVAPQAELRTSPAHTILPAQWSTRGDVISPVINMPANLNGVHSSSWTSTVGTGAAAGLLLLKLQRNTVHASDNFPGTVSVIGMRVSWYYV